MSIRRFWSSECMLIIFLNSFKKKMYEQDLEMGLSLKDEYR